MIRQIFKIIWAERKINIWILFELVLVFCILWFCADYIYFFTKRYVEPTGYNIEQTYRINLGVKEDGFEVINNGSEEEKLIMLNTLWTIIDRIKRYPDVKNVSLSFAAAPYSGSFSNNSFTLDSVVDYIQTKTVTPEYFEVFDIGILQGDVNNWSNRDNIVISGNKDNLFLKKDVKEIRLLDFGNDNFKKVIGIAEPTKMYDFDPFTPVIYQLLSPNDLEAIDVESGTEICVRIREGADKEFVERFTRDIQQQIALDPYFLSSVTSFNYHKKDFMRWYGFDNNFKSIFSISTFLLVNIFLAVVGTFWFRTQSRRSEIGLRIALGASRKNIRMIFILETVTLIFLASIVATVLCVNIAQVEVLKDIGLPSVDRSREGVGVSQYFVDYIITFFILTVISILAVWYPARRASQVQPAEALKDE